MALGRPTVKAGSISATCAPIRAVPPTLNFILRSWSVMTAQSVTSLPVPAVVGTVTSGGMRFVVGGLPSSYLGSEEHTSELQSRQYLVCRLLLSKKKHHKTTSSPPPLTAS